MHFTATTLAALLLAASAIASPVQASRRDADDNDANTNIFPDASKYDDWAICKGKITKKQFPNLQAPTQDGGCVRYYQGVDITGVVTQHNFFFKDGFKSACDCAAKCLENPTSCTNWVWKHTFMPGDDGKRSCTIYSSPNLPLNVTLDYFLANSTGYQPLQPGNNPQAGADAPITTLDQAGQKLDKYGVSGFMVRDASGKQYC